MAEKIGLEAVLATKEFQSGLGVYLSGISKMQGTTASVAGSVSGSMGGVSRSIQGAASAASSAISPIGSLGSALGGVLQVAGGFIVAGVFEKMASGLGQFVSTGLSAVNEAQKLETGLGALLTQNNLYERSIEQVTVATGNFAEEQAKAAQKANDLSFANRDLTARLELQRASIQEQKERIRQLTEQYGANGLATIEAAEKLETMEIGAEKLQRQIDKNVGSISELSNIQQEYSTSTVTSFKQVMDFADAQKLAAEQTQQLLGFVDKLSIISPFEQEQVALVTKYAIGAGLGVDQTKRFTAGFLDLAAAVGIGSESLAFASDQLLQVSKVGKITEIDLRQLRRLGIDLEKIIGVEMGMSLEEFNAEAAKSPEIFNTLFDSVSSFSEKTFAGASQRMATSLGGLASTATDIFRVGAKNMLRPIVEAVGPTISDMLGAISDIVTGPELAAIGTQLGTSVAQGLGVVKVAIDKVMGAFSRFGVRGAAVSILGMLGLDPSQIGGIMAVADTITEAIGKITGAFERFGVKGAAVSIAGMLGIDPTTIGLIFTTFDEIIAKIGIVSQVFQQFGAQGAAVSILSILGLSSETIGTITTVIAAITIQFTEFVNFWVTNWPVIQAAAQTAWIILQGIFNGIVMALTPAITQLTASFQQVGVALSGLGINWSTVWNAIVTATGIVAAGIGALIVGVIAVVTGLVTALAAAATSIISTWVGLADSFTMILTGWATTFAGFVNLFNALIAGEWTAAWEAVKLIVEGGVTTIGGIVQGMLTLFTGAFSLILNTIDGFVDGFLAVFQGLYNTLIGNSIIPDMVNDIVQWFTLLPQKIVSALSNFVQTVSKPFKEAANGIIEVWEETDWAEIGEGTILGILDGIEKNAHLVLEVLKQMAADALAGVMDTLGISSPSTVFAEVGANIIQGLVAGVDGEGDSVQSAIMRTLDFSARMFRVGGLERDESMVAETAINNTFNRLYGAIANGTAGVSELIADFQAQLGPPNFDPSEVSDAIGAVDFQGIVDTIRSQFGPLTIELKAQAVALAQSFSGIATAFAGMLQEQMGSMDAANAVYDEYAKELAKITKEADKLTASLGKVQEKSVSLQQDLANETEQQRILNEEIAAKNKTIADWTAELDTLVAAGEGQSAQADKLRDKIKKEELARDKLNLRYTEQEQKIADITKALEEQAKAAADLQKQLDDAAKAQAELNQKAKDQIFKTLTQGHGGVGPFAKITDQIAALQQFLDSGETTLAGKVWDDALGEWVNWSLDRNTAQAKLNELLQEQLEMEEAIRKAQEQQQQLAFLQQQISLMKLIADQGLDPSEILAGITLGLDASIDDLLKATNAVVQAMIDQMNKDLGIASPSKVMAKLGGRVMQGLAGGVEKGKSLLSSVVSGTPILNGAMPSFSPVTQNVSPTNNKTLNMGGIHVGNINNGMDVQGLEQLINRTVVAGFR